MLDLPCDCYTNLSIVRQNFGVLKINIFVKNISIFAIFSEKDVEMVFILVTEVGFDNIGIPLALKAPVPVLSLQCLQLRNVECG